MSFTQQLQVWFYQNQRLLPFRFNKDPYRIWIAEIMAQQTQIDTMIPYYTRWLTKWPILQTLAETSENEILKQWEGLGYYSRARNIHRAIQILKHQSFHFPNNLAEISQLPGIGPYTAAAIASICFETPCVALDGNVYRVVSRLFELQDELGSKILLKKVTTHMEEWMSTAIPSVFTQAMMELGALICTPQNPDCTHCPIKETCLAFKNNTMHLYPIKKTSKAKPIIQKTILLLVSPDHKIVLTLDHSDRLMQGYWRFPETTVIPKEAIFLGHKHHVFTHLVWDLDFYRLLTQTDALHHWFTSQEIEDLPVVTAHRDFFEKTKTKIFVSES